MATTANPITELPERKMYEIARKVFPHPILSLVVLAVWLMLWDSLSAGVVVLGAIVGVVMPIFARRFWPHSPEVQSYRPLVSYLLLFGWDILVANLSVALSVVMPNSKLEPTFLEIPLEIDHPFLITILANTISLTPGTVTTNVAGDRGHLLVHCMHTDDPEEEIRQIKERYEARLQEIFE